MKRKSQLSTEMIALVKHFKTNRINVKKIRCGGAGENKKFEESAMKDGLGLNDNDNDNDNDNGNDEKSTDSDTPTTPEAKTPRIGLQKIQMKDDIQSNLQSTRLQTRMASANFELGRETEHGVHFATTEDSDNEKEENDTKSRRNETAGAAIQPYWHKQQ